MRPTPDADAALGVDADGGDFLPGPLDRCPECGAGDVDVVFDGDMVNFLCLGCRRCWHVELGYLQQVDPLTCPGCAQPDRCRACPLPGAVLDLTAEDASLPRTAPSPVGPTG